MGVRLGCIVVVGVEGWLVEYLLGVLEFRVGGKGLCVVIFLGNVILGSRSKGKGDWGEMED